MVHRSYLCLRKYSIPFRSTLYYNKSRALTSSIKYPGLLLQHPRQTQIRTLNVASVNSIINQTKKLDLNTPLKPSFSLNIRNDSSLPETKELDFVLNNEYTPNQAKEFYHRLASTSPNDLASLFSSKIKNYDYDKKLRQVFLDASSFWSIEVIQAVMAAWGTKYSQLRLDLFTNNLLPNYVLSRDIAAVINSLPLNGKPTDLLPFYNAALSQCLRHKEYNHLRLVLSIMKERSIKPDVASHNILLRMSLIENKNTSGFEVYQKLIAEGMTPSHATYNTFINHEIHHKQWQSIAKWLDLMEENGVKPTQVTIRILFHALSKYPLEKELGQSYDRVTRIISPTQKEKLTNISAASLLKSGKAENAMDVLRLAFGSNLPLSVRAYNLLLKALCDQGKVENAQQILDMMITSKNKMPKPDIVSFTTVIHGLIYHPNENTNYEVAVLYSQLTEQGFHSNNVLQSVILSHLTKSDNLEKTRTLFDTILKNKNQLRIPQQSNDQPLTEINIYNMMIDCYFLHYHKSKKYRGRSPQQPIQLLNQVLKNKQLKPTVVTLNIMVRGLAILNHDLNAAEKIVQLFKERGVDMDERTVWYLAKTAHRQGQISRVRELIERYESQGHSIQGSGLKALKAL